MRGFERFLTLTAVTLILFVGARMLGENNKFVQEALADSQGPNSTTANCTDDAGTGTVAWQAADLSGKVNSSDNSYADIGLDGNASHYLKCTTFGFSIPSGNTIDGIVVGIERRSTSTGNGGSGDHSVKIVRGGNVTGDDRATSTIYTTSDTYEDHGAGTTDKWGIADWTTSDINSTNFGVAIAVTKPNAAGPGHTIAIDHVRITVYHSTPSGTVNVTTVGAQTGSVGRVNDVYLGAFKLFRDSGSTIVTGIRINEIGGTVDASTNLKNIKFRYDLDAAAPYDCADQSYQDTDSQFGATDTDGFSGADGESHTFSGSVTVSDTQAMCIYVIVDVQAGAGESETINIQMSDPPGQVTVSSGSVAPSGQTDIISGVTTITSAVPRVRIRVALSNDVNGPGGSWDDADFLGPGCNVTTAYESANPGELINLNHNCYGEKTHRYMRYKIQLDGSATLSAVKVNYAKE